MLLNTIRGPAGPPTLKKIAMHKQVLMRILVGGLLALACRPAWAQGFGGPEFDPGPPPETKPASKPPRIRRPVTIKLPEQYRSKDINKDGQIGMYEWPRSDYATFRRLDLNHDGFLTPLELTSSSSRSTLPAVALAPTDTSGTVVATTTTAIATGSAESTGATSPAPSTTGSRSEAERFFEVVDKDKNGKITEEELKRSFLVSKKFSDAGIAAVFPLNRDEFIRLYPQPAK